MKKNTILTFIIGVFIFNSCGEQPQQVQQMPALTIPVIEVGNRDMIGYKSYPVNIEGKVNNEIRAKISGYIKEVFIDEGQQVTKGQALFRLETDVQSQNANAALSGVNAAKANVTAAQASVNAAQVEVNKLIPLVDKKIISEIQLETAKANLSRTQSQLEQAKAAQQQAEANYNSIQANIDFAVVRSPITGVIGSINFREGSLVGPADPLPITTVSETEEVYAYFSMSEGEYLDFLENTEGNSVKEKLTNLPEVELILANGKPYLEKGKIQTVTGQIDPATGSIKFRAGFNNSNGLLSNGNSGFIQIPIPYENALIIPEVATYEQQGNTYVYLSKEGKVLSTPIQVESRINNIILVKSGLDKGSKIAAQGLGRLRNEMPIQEQLVELDEIVNAIKPIK